VSRHESDIVIKQGGTLAWLLHQGGEGVVLTAMLRENTSRSRGKPDYYQRDHRQEEGNHGHREKKSPEGVIGDEKERKRLRAGQPFRPRKREDPQQKRLKRESQKNAYSKEFGGGQDVDRPPTSLVDLSRRETQSNNGRGAREQLQINAPEDFQEKIAKEEGAGRNWRIKTSRVHSDEKDTGGRTDERAK